MTTQKAIKAADLDDLLFAGRNKKYGAYELRKNYDKRLTVAIIAAVSFFILTLAGLNMIPNPKTSLIDVVTNYHHDSNIIQPPPVFEEHQQHIKHGGNTGISVMLTHQLTEDIDTTKIHSITGHGHDLPGLLTDGGSFIGDNFGFSGREIIVKPKMFDPVPDQNAEFPGGEDAYQNYLKSNIKYPNFAAANGIEGTIWLSLKIDEEGNVVDVSVLRAIGGGCDDEAVRVLRNMPRWKPGRKNGENIAVIRYVKVHMELR